MRRVNSTVGMSGEIEQVITKLLRTTKSLLEALTQWSQLRASNNDIFEIHDTLEKQFFLVSQAFEDATISMSDLQWIPRQLRDSVTLAMLDTPSAAALDQHLPRIREVIVHLLHGLKGKQAQLREKERERESRVSMRTSSSTDWNREVPLAALNRSNGSRVMMYPVPSPSSPPLPPHPPISPRSNPTHSDYEPWTGGMPRPSIPTHDLSSRIMPRPNRSYSPPHTSPRLQHQQTSPLLQHQQTSPRIQSQQIPSRSNSYTRLSQVQMPPPPPPPPLIKTPPTFDETDPNTASALAALKRQENLARRSSVRRASMYRTGAVDYTTAGNNLRSKSELTPPVPTLPSKTSDQTPTRLNVLSEESEEEQKPETKENQSLTLFLQIGKQVQKVQYQGEISITSLNMLFLEKFSYSLGQNDFPKIYIRDPSVGVSYELTDLSEVKDKSVLSFNIDEEEKETKKEWLLEVTQAFNKELSETRRALLDQMEQIKTQLSETQLTQPEIEPIEVSTSPQEVSLIRQEQFEAQRTEIEQLRRDLAIVRQLEREMRDELGQVIEELKERSVRLQETVSASPSARTHLEEGKKALLETSDKITNRLEDLQDTIDQLKLDVTQRKCRPSEAQMAHCAAERKALSAEIDAFAKSIGQVKPRWKKTWEKELQTIVKEQQVLKDQEYLLSDMKDDLEALLEVYEQLEKICAYQVSARPQLREFRVAPVEEGFEGMDSVLKQVQTIDVDSERRLKAMEQAEKMRQRELANRIDDFEKELVGFVDSKKLKKTGGALEIDRIRKQKDEEMMKALFIEKKAAAAAVAEANPELVEE